MLTLVFNALYFTGILDEVKKPEFAGGVTLRDGSCGGQWRYPRNCLPENGTCEYAIQWTYKGKKVICLVPMCSLYAKARRKPSPSPTKPISRKFFFAGSDNICHLYDAHESVDRGWIFR